MAYQSHGNESIVQPGIMPDESAVVQAESDNSQRQGTENATDDGQGRRGADSVRIGVGLPLENQLQWRHHATRHGSMVERKKRRRGRRGVEIYCAGQVTENVAQDSRDPGWLLVL